MVNLLQKMLNEVVVTPYDVEITKRLAEICGSIAEEVKVKNISTYIGSFVQNEPDMSFKKMVEDKYVGRYPDEEAIVLPPLFSIVLAQYITYIAINRYFTGLDQATASLILMNYMLYRKGSLTRLILPDYIQEMYFKMDQYIDSKDDIEISETFKHLGGIFSDENYIAKNYDDEDLQKEVKQLAKIAHFYQQQNIVRTYLPQTTNQLYVKVYQFLKEVLEKTEWKFLKCNVVALIKKILTEEEQKKIATIDGIINELRPVVGSSLYGQIESSSLLLRYIAGEEIPKEMMSRRLTIMEFGVYVYYEMLLENIIDEYYGN